MAEPEPARQRRDMTLQERAWEDLAKSRFGGWFAINVATRADRILLPLSNGRFSISGGKIPIGLLTAVGAKSGQVRATPLLYLQRGDDVVLVASKIGAERSPGWYFNLKAHPEVTFLGKTGMREYVAREAVGKERSDLWAEVNDLYSGYDDYQQRTGGRRIPVMVLEPKP